VIRDARIDEVAVLEDLQRRSSSIRDEYRDLIAAYPDAVVSPRDAVLERRVRVATGAEDEPRGFSVVATEHAGARELDGLFVAPGHMRNGVGRALVEDVAERARGDGARRLEVTAGPGSAAFYERVGFVPGEWLQTRFGPARRMHLTLDG
jgi:GNAT superfamily N-acetyltransferase